MEISLASEQITHFFGFPITNTLLLSWVVMGILITLGAVSTYRLNAVPRGLQNALEAVIEKLFALVKSVIGTDKDTEKVFPFIVTFFVFILVSNWFGLIPGVGTIGVEHGQGDQRMFLPFLRAPTSDLNTTLAFAFISVIITNIFGIATIGFTKYAGKFISFKSPIAFFVGILESVAEIAKILSFSFRLFGNVFAGEVLLVVIASLIPYIAPIPFLGLEVFVGFIQALVFSMLTLVFIKVAITAAH
ncbi:MAG: F0F1 ATP synthase subunit A [Candidatus Spechtbacteria bacterium]|nr:F0F1 ATP synthase subunit A [Candidatus Spechtbacteria bacterium]